MKNVKTKDDRSVIKAIIWTKRVGTDYNRNIMLNRDHIVAYILQSETNSEAKHKEDVRFEIIFHQYG